MIFPSCHSPALISSCLLAKIRTKKKTLPCVTQEKENSQRHYPARLIMGKKKKRGGGGGRRIGQHWSLTSWDWF
jgi:hypothetical protein